MLVAQNSAPSRHLGSVTAAVTGARNVGRRARDRGDGRRARRAGCPRAPELPAPGEGSELSAGVFSHAFHPVFWAAAG